MFEILIRRIVGELLFGCMQKLCHFFLWTATPRIRFTELQLAYSNGNGINMNKRKHEYWFLYGALRKFWDSLTLYVCNMKIYHKNFHSWCSTWVRDIEQRKNNIINIFMCLNFFLHHSCKLSELFEWSLLMTTYSVVLQKLWEKK